jgi:hypothetical protein
MDDATGRDHGDGRHHVHHGWEEGSSDLPPP